MKKYYRTTIFSGLLLALLAPSNVYSQFSLDEEPINYYDVEPNDPITDLQKKIDSGKVKLEFNEKNGYLTSVLKELKIPKESQLLVFSKTSFQLPKINPSKPRAVYFNDEVYMGWVQYGDVLEISANDPLNGTMFYSLDQEETESPKFLRHTDRCTICHASSRTERVPGHLVRSVFPDKKGNPLFKAGTFSIDHRSPIKNRWGGWYVSGHSGKQTHMGNMTIKNKRKPEEFNPEEGANLTDLSRFFDTSPYMTPYSDIVSLMVVEHQGRMQNLFTRANFHGRSALYQEKVLNKALKREKNYRSETTQRQFNHVGEKVVEYLLFSDEEKLTDKISGVSGFTEMFQKKGIKDKKGRSLRDFDLEKRIFKYPCSYLIHSEAFDVLPEPVKKYIFKRMWDILNQKVDEKKYAHLSKEDCHNIIEILRDTKKGLPDYWQIEAVSLK